MLKLSISSCAKTKRVRLVIAIHSYERVDVKYAGSRSKSAPYNSTRQRLLFYLNLALDNGVKPAEISKIVGHRALYSGWGLVGR